MEKRINCSLPQCEAGACYIHPALSNHAGDILHTLCSLSMRGVELQGRVLSPVVCAVVWALLSCGILLSAAFLLFTLRFRNNRLVKMSSPNLNVLTLCGSVLTYSSGFLFAIEERTLLQARIWTLCLGSSLVFGPILGKTWRLYRVFTQRVPDKRVIIRDIQLMGLVLLLILVDVVVLTAWGLTDPLQCARSINAVVKVVEWEVSYSLSQMDSCSSHYSDLWIILLSVLKGSLLLYGTYLAGLTSDVSLPPVNQSVAITGAVCLVTVATAVAVPVWRYLQAWPNLVYGVVSGAIFTCTLATNCLLFVPQLLQWRHFEEEVNSSSQMAKYFSSPSRGPSSYSQDQEQLYYLRLLTEKNAVIDSLQEQVSSAKDKLLKLMSVSPLHEDGEMDSSTTNLNSTSTQTTVVQPEAPPTPLLQRDADAAPPPLRSPPPYVPPPRPPSVAPSVAPHQTSPASPSDGAPQCGVECALDRLSLRSSREEEVPLASPFSQPSHAQAPTPLSPPWSGSAQVDASGSVAESTASPAVTGGVWPGFVSSEQLQEILQDLSVDAARRPSLRLPGNPARDTLAPLLPPLSPRSPFQLHYPSISPYAMRKRRPPFHSSRAGPPPYCYPGSASPRSQGRSPRETAGDPEPIAVATRPRQPDSRDDGSEEGEGGEGESFLNLPASQWSSRDRKLRRSAPPLGCPEGAGRGVEGGQRSRDPFGYSDLDSSSSEEEEEEEECGYYHRPYCHACRHRHAQSDSSSSSSSDSLALGRYAAHPVVNFNQDLKPTFV